MLLRSGKHPAIAICRQEPMKPGVTNIQWFLKTELQRQVLYDHKISVAIYWLMATSSHLKLLKSVKGSATVNQ